MSEIADRLKGSSGTSCRYGPCMMGVQVCPHSDEEIIESLERACGDGAVEIERLRTELDELKLANERLKAQLRSSTKLIIELQGKRTIADREIERLKRGTGGTR